MWQREDVVSSGDDNCPCQGCGTRGLAGWPKMKRILTRRTYVRPGSFGLEETGGGNECNDKTGDGGTALLAASLALGRGWDDSNYSVGSGWLLRDV